MEIESISFVSEFTTGIAIAPVPLPVISIFGKIL
jgi:hypothetical protein